jgi:hypothetical protein
MMMGLIRIVSSCHTIHSFASLAIYPRREDNNIGYGYGWNDGLKNTDIVYLNRPTPVI